jgi:hypothetical protein
MRIDKFMAAISKVQPLDVTRWGLFIGRPGIDNERLNLTIRNVSVPGRKIAGNDFSAGLKRTIAAREEFTDDLAMEFLVGKDGYERDLFNLWMNHVVDPTSGNPNYYVNYVCDLGLQQYDKQGILRYAWKFYEIYPTELEAIDLGNDSQDGDAAFVTVKVKFAYKNFLASGVQTPVKVVQDKIEQMQRQPPAKPPTPVASQSSAGEQKRPLTDTELQQAIDRTRAGIARGPVSSSARAAEGLEKRKQFLATLEREQRRRQGISS